MWWRKVREPFIFLQNVKESEGTFFKCWLLLNLKMLWFALEKCRDYHFMLQVKLLTKYHKFSWKFVSRSGTKSGNLFQIFGGNPVIDTLHCKVHGLSTGQLLKLIFPGSHISRTRCREYTPSQLLTLIWTGGATYIISTLHSQVYGPSNYSAWSALKGPLI